MMNYQEIDLTVGIEIHQELATKHKLFCACNPKLNTEKPDYFFERKLRPSQSELGEMDPAALFEFLKGKTIIYEADYETSCLVEMDEEPPGPLDSEALDITLIFGLMVGAKPVDEVHIMRKTVVDGSNTGGFQRTSVISLGGLIEIEDKKYRLDQICLEEDAARKIREKGNTITYRLDRLGIPLLEVTTGPDIHTPTEAKTVAARIGKLLRATGMVRRGLGTIRQDINVSILGGPVIEIKGVQDLDQLDTVVKYEAKRQLTLLQISDELKKRVTPKKLRYKTIDISKIFKNTKCEIISDALRRKGVVLALKLPGFRGIIGKELCPNRRLGTEMSDHAKFKGGVKGIFHTDELPGYNITENEVFTLLSKVEADKNDAVVIVADEKEKSEKALMAVFDRAIQAFNGIPEETRSANTDGTTRYTRPRPGAARMYPETDINAIKISSKRIERLKKNIPEMPEKKLLRIKKKYNLNEKLANQILDSDYLDLFQEIASIGVSTTLIAVTLTEDFKRFHRDGYPIENIKNNEIMEVFILLKKGLIVKESIPEIFVWLSKNPNKSALDALKELRIKMITKEELTKIIDSILEDNSELIIERGMRAMGPLMGLLMRDVRGGVNAKEAQILLQIAMKKKLDSFSHKHY
jgi:glutamyl-tRNA(Gln) amidotransferase subunit E